MHLSIPIIGVSVPFSVLTLNKNGTVNVPTNFSEPGWYNGDRSPGQKGSAVILGHVDNYHGPAVFYHLDKLNLGNRVDVTLADGRKLVFAVIGERMYKKTNFPDALVYGARTYPALQLVTCGGIFDPSDGSLPLEHRRLHRTHQVVAYAPRTSLAPSITHARHDFDDRHAIDHVHSARRSDESARDVCRATTSRQTPRKFHIKSEENTNIGWHTHVASHHARALLRTL